MMGFITKLEEIITILMERIFQGRGFEPVDLNRLAIRCMEQGSRRGINRVYAPNRFVILFNPADYKDLAPILNVIQADILQGLEKYAAESNYLVAGRITLKIKEDTSVKEGVPLVRGCMAGSDEPDSVVEYERKGDLSGGGAGMDSGQIHDNVDDVIVAEPQTMLEEGVTILREGRPEDALEVLSAIDDDEKDNPVFQAAIGSCKLLLGHEEEAQVHFSRLRELEPAVRRLPLPGLETPEQEEKNDVSLETVQKNLPGYRLETQIAGVSLIFKEGGLLLENRYQDPAAKVDGRVEQEIRLEPGNMLALGTVRLYVRKA